ncbi:hypothetical protein LX15_002942 [Streptoalloteichus tenebrarius]|uniref:Uncharacterized protein n=1 Tax=Streptoalloteichus tenebrarius (strain ATCC 17920 / DSM 40477 / JCM 4838 / CBS 697.72 / NBRC 16177 / NCIMB 11028 / NRRL B-12390 / A12253. 1 / ISP 5477) TaxID=1933 RepID=A0ABT1HUN9_STRSD|nr:hypothetical protein [Streptoalloteichus tenebrarius]MCP2259241.1 hypothetical protein [Streptoalloteichus tenebrarius]BFE98999.1 hypothetical protein GCM10020241_06750 [Streptoalloteichus tenebrarius]
MTGTDRRLRDGDVVVGRIDRPGQVVRYDLDLGGATVFRLHDVTGAEQGLDVDLAGPVAGDAPGFTVTSAYQYRVRPSAPYRLEVTRRSGATGPFGFRVVTGKDRRLTAKLGDRISGRLDVSGRVDLYAFQPDSPTTVRLANGSPCQGIVVALVEDGPAPHAYTPSNPCWDIALGAVEPGRRYLLAVWSDAGKTGTYTFDLGPR